MRKVKSILAVMLAATMTLSLAACGKKPKVIDHKAFKAALEEIKIDDDDLFEQKNGSMGKYDYNRSVAAYDGDCYYLFVEFEDASDCAKYFEKTFYDDYEDMIEDKDFDGKTSGKNAGSYGYILVDGESDADDFGDGDVYGGIYYRDNILVVVLANSDKKSDKSDIDTVISALGYPKP